ncbi:MAG: dTMP kinase [Wenzhouxiangellaceae bacterium]|nr:dTMP kinase [Wenzhouxiangellaceae bacterium]
MIKGRMICLEGGEGAGKSTALAVVRDWLESRARNVLTTREPGGTPTAEKIRALLLDPATGKLDPVSELLLMFAARRENVVNVIAPALEEGIDVICDRFTDASYAYQGAGRGLGDEPVDRLAQMVHPELVPDLVLVMDVPVELGLQRIRARAAAPDRFEADRAEFLERVRRAYLARAAQNPRRYAVIDASRDLPDVAATLRDTLAERLE